MLIKALSILLFLCTIPSWSYAATGSAAADTWYVRPTGACANNGDGLAYGCAASAGATGAFSTFANIIWTGTTGVDDDDTLYVCGAHLTMLGPTASGGVGHNIIANGACPDDPGSINTTSIVSDVTDGVQLLNISNWTVKNFTMIQGRRVGILIYSTTGNKSGFTLSGNTIDQRIAGSTTNSCHGIWVTGTGTPIFDNVLIENNTVLGTKLDCSGVFNDAMSLEGVNTGIVRGNTLTGTFSGVDLSGPSAGPFFILSNTMRHIRGMGVRIEGSLGCLSGFVVSGNLIDNAGEWGVSWYDIANSVFSNNTVRVFHDSVSFGSAPYGAMTVGGDFACPETGNTFRNNIFEGNYNGGVIVSYDGTRATFESTTRWDHNRINQYGSQAKLFGWIDDAGNDMTEANHATWAASHAGDTYGDVTYMGPVCSAETCTITSNLRLPAGSTLRRAGFPVVCIDVRGRACYPDRPDIGAYQATSGDQANTR